MIQPDSSQMQVAGRAVSFRSPRDALAAGSSEQSAGLPLHYLFAAIPMGGKR